MSSRVTFLGKMILGTVVGFFPLATPNSIQAQNNPVAERQRERARRVIHKEMEDRRALIEIMRRKGVPEAQLEKIAKIFLEDHAKKIAALEVDKRQVNKRDANSFPTLSQKISIATGVGVSLIVLGLLLKSGPKDKKELPQQPPSGQNYLGEKIDQIDWTKPIDLDAALEALIKLRDELELPKEKQTEIKKIFSRIIFIIDRLKTINTKENLTIDDKPKIREIYFELGNELDQLTGLLEVPDVEDVENEIIVPERQELSTEIKALRK